MRLAAGVAVGLLAASHQPCRADTPTLEKVMDATKDSSPVRCVIVGGGYAGSKLAYQLDSIFNVTLVDTKNYFEITSDIIPIISSPWTEKNSEACKKLQVLHRYYLKRANVLTGTAETVSETAVKLSDGRVVPYDILILANGEKKSFPFETKQKTLSNRLLELKGFNEFLSTTKKVAIVGGGPMGVSLAAQLAEDRPQMEVHLFHSQARLIPSLPEISSDAAFQHLRARQNVKLHMATNVTNVKAKSVVEFAQSQPPRWKFWQQNTISVPQSFVIDVERLEYAFTPLQSIVSQVFMGKRRQKPSATVISRETLEDYDYVFNLGCDTPRVVATAGEFLASHITPDGHIQVSTLMQLFGHPNIFAVGRCNNLNWTRGLGSSDLQARTLFRMINSIINSTNPKLLQTSDGLRMDRLLIPRLLVRLGNQDACGSTPWSGGMSGLNALREFIQDRGHLQREFLTPIFYKQQDPARVFRRFTEWRAKEVTDITDFSHS